MMVKRLSFYARQRNEDEVQAIEELFHEILEKSCLRKAKSHKFSNKDLDHKGDQKKVFIYGKRWNLYNPGETSKQGLVSYCISKASKATKGLSDIDFTITHGPNLEKGVLESIIKFSSTCCMPIKDLSKMHFYEYEKEN